MRARPRAAFVVTVSMIGSVALAACGKTGGAGGSSECKPPDCHMNPPPPPPTPPTVGPTMISANPPAVDNAKDAGSKPLAK